MARDAARMRGDRPVVFTNLKTGEGLDAVVAFVKRKGMVGQLPELSGETSSKPGVNE